MRFEWDETKNQQNIRKHHIDFADVQAVFTGPMIIALDNRQEYGEDRWIGMGFLLDLVIVVVWVEQTEDVIRIISARKANRQERERYEQFLAN